MDGTPELRDGESRTATIRWETKYCPRCRSQTTFWYVRDDLLRCAQCREEIDLARGLGLGPDSLKG